MKSTRMIKPLPTDQGMRVLVLWADDASPNLGVRALGRGTEALIRRVWPQADVTFQNYGHRSPHMVFGPLRTLVREQATARLGMQKWLTGFDLVVDTRSGDSFSDIYGLRRHTTMSAVAACVKRAGVPVVMGPQTIGPFNHTRGRLLARQSLKGAHLVMARDSESLIQAKRLDRNFAVLTTDVVFALDVPKVDKTRDVLLNISGLLWNPNPHVDFQHYRREVARLHGQLLAEGREVSLLAHVLNSNNLDNDVPALREYAQSSRHPVEVIIPVDLDDVRRIVASAGLVVASRMHACLNALSVGTPAIPLAYSVKFQPLFEGLGWDRTVDLRHGAPAPAEKAMEYLSASNLVPDTARLVGKAHTALALAEQSLRTLT